MVKCIETDVALRVPLFLKSPVKQQAISQRKQVLPVLSSLAQSNGLLSLFEGTKEGKGHQIFVKHVRLLARNDVDKASLSFLHLVHFVFVLKYTRVTLKLLTLLRPVNKRVLLEPLYRKVD